MVVASLLRNSGNMEQNSMAMAVVNYFSQSVYHACIIPLLGVTLSLAYLTKPTASDEQTPSFVRFKYVYLSVWSLCVAADWLQGPYIYALYAAHGYTTDQIAKLFVAGFGTALIFGCIVGPVADRFGRKKCCLAYCVVYVLSCLTVHVRNFEVLLLGRMLGGIATAILFSCFECWMVSETLNNHNLSSNLLSYLFGLKFMVMYCVAIGAGLMAEGVASWVPFAPLTKDALIWHGGACMPFDVSIWCNVAGFFIILFFWSENYGSTNDQGLLEMLPEACRLLGRSMNILCLCVVVACFEGSMYAFVFHWTPALKDQMSQTEPPYGVIFAVFMMACMCGASVSTLVAKRSRPATRLVFLCGVGVLAFLVSSATAASSGHMLNLCFFAFLAFEFAVGLYFPSIGLLKSELVPEHVRSTMYNLFRIPLNAVVLLLLLTNLTEITCFRLCAALLGISLLATYKMVQSTLLTKEVSEETPLSKSV